MKSEDKNKNKMSKATYYSVVALSLAVIGSVSWFTVSRMGNVKNSKPNDQVYEDNSSYFQGDDEYNSDGTFTADSNTPDGTADVAISKPEVPYENPAADTVKFSMPVEGAIIKPFSNTTLQYSKTYGDMRLHEGIDIKCDEGTAVKAMADGVIADVFDDPAYGKTVIVDHKNGVNVKYCGFKSIAVIKGSEVFAGDTLGMSGTVPCECKDAPHLHLEAADIDSLDYILGIFASAQN